ncbi:MAG: hypothetical protein QNJ89_07240 [Acidimicrobiia bacterium]|nr:hypothetical protein [Acidimicrobiia bacterium]
MSSRLRSIVVFATALALAACGSTDTTSAATTDTSPTTSAPATSTTAATPATTQGPTTTAKPPETTTSTTLETTTTTLDPALANYAGLWQWLETDQKLMRLEADGSLAIGYALDGAPQLGLRGAVGDWGVADGVISMMGLGLGDCSDDAVGSYEIQALDDGFVMVLLDDECPDRARWLLGEDSTSQTWVLSDL